jgi:hypothetical protein
MMTARNTLSTLLALVGAALLLAGAAAAYARVQVTEREVFADRALEALEAQSVQRAVEEEIVNALAGRARSLGAGDLRRDPLADRRGGELAALPDGVPGGRTGISPGVLRGRT